jgi:hypothetical protein
MPRAAARRSGSMVPMLRTVFLYAAALLACAPALGQDYSGTYTAKNASGGTVTLTLEQDGEKQASGTLTGHGTSSLQVVARVESKGLRGTAGNAFGMLYLTGRLTDEELSIVLTEPDVGGKPNPKRATTLRLARMPVKMTPKDGALGEALTRNAWCSFAYTTSGTLGKERMQFLRNGLVNQTPGKQARWRVQNETLQFSRDGVTWSPERLRLALNSSGSPVLLAYDKEYVQCD